MNRLRGADDKLRRIRMNRKEQRDAEGREKGRFEGLERDDPWKKRSTRWHVLDSRTPYAPPPQDQVHMVSLEELIGTVQPPPPAARQMRLFDAGGTTRLWCAGHLSLARRPSVAIVGTRHPTRDGAARARRLASELARADIVVVSGLARGIDTDALAGALDSGGRVVAVIGTPLDQAYPAENRRLQERIYGDHLLVSQFEPGWRMHHSNFPMRNRLMAALSDATVIIEAGEHSGTLHQATECVRLGRWLFIAQAIASNTRLKWPARFLGKPRVRVLASTDDILAIV
jgi:DNA processing protein